MPESFARQTMPRNKIVIAYLGLVGIPLLGLAGILRTGQHLVAPLSMSGAWKVEADVSVLASAACGNLLPTIAQPFFNVSQSGGDLTVRIADSHATMLSGNIRGTTLRIGEDGGPSQDCRNPAAIRLQGTVTGARRQRVVTGTLGIAGCGSCSDIPFRATRAR
jgi:hypothetical protein